MTITYAIQQPITVEQFIDILNRSSLGQRRPVHDRECMQGMLDHASLLVTACYQNRLVGVARCVTDFYYCCYLSELAVDQAFQKQGIGKQLMQHVQSQLNSHCKIILLSAPAAVEYYPHIGFEHHPQAWVLAPAQRKVKSA